MLIPIKKSPLTSKLQEIDVGISLKFSIFLKDKTEKNHENKKVAEHILLAHQLSKHWD